MIDSTHIDELLAEAKTKSIKAQGQLRTTIDSIGMTRRYVGHDPQLELMMNLDNYIAKGVTVGILTFFTTPYFYDAIMRSAAEKQP